jgi:hypothetical protein
MQKGILFHMAITLTTKQQIISMVVGGLLLLGLALTLGYISGQAERDNVTRWGGNNYSGQHTISDINSTTVSPTSTSDTDRLLFLIEEEKLAHDVYTKLYEKYGARVFSSISRSETTHGARLLDLLDARGIDDPRSSELGVFKNTDLQKLYDTLIAQGNQNITEAYKVGVAIEEKDIADIEADLKNIDASHTDIIDALNSLLRGSRNHLQAFNRQLG